MPLGDDIGNFVKLENMFIRVWKHLLYQVQNERPASEPTFSEMVNIGACLFIKTLSLVQLL